MGSSVPLVQAFNLCEGSIIASVQFVHWYDLFKVQLWSTFLVVQSFNWLKGSISSRVPLVKFAPGFNWFKCSICVRDQLVQGFN